VTTWLSDKPHLVRALRDALGHLYDPRALRASPLAQALGVAGRADTPAALRDLLTRRIQALKPTADVPRDSRAWRIYHILHYRFVEQLTQQEVATDLALGIRQLRRQERVALQALADALWAAYDFESGSATSEDDSAAADDRALKAEHMPSRNDELDWLKDTVPRESVNLVEMLSKALGTLNPLVQSSAVTLDLQMPPDLPPLNVQRTSLRQALLSLISAATCCAPGGQLRLIAESEASTVCVSLQATGQPTGADIGAEEATAHLRSARELVEISGGSLKILAGAEENHCFAAQILLPAESPATVLAIDDNIDTLRLLHRYLAGTRYRTVDTRDPEEAIALAAELAPQVILLDVMLPACDGWELLERLREHPETAHIPVVVCTILPQDRLADLLGAAGFLQKPVSRQSLLAELDRLLARTTPGSS
jgi:CheY-like chemotaxis protein